MHLWKSLTILLLSGMSAVGYAEVNVANDAPAARNKSGLQSALTQLKKDIDVRRADIEESYKDKQEALRAELTGLKDADDSDTKSDIQKQLAANQAQHRAQLQKLKKEAQQKRKEILVEYADSSGSRPRSADSKVVAASTVPSDSESDTPASETSRTAPAALSGPVVNGAAEINQPQSSTNASPAPNPSPAAPLGAPQAVLAAPQAVQFLQSGTVQTPAISHTGTSSDNGTPSNEPQFKIPRLSR